MRYLHVVRVLTLLMAICYSFAVLPTEWLSWLEDRFTSYSAIYHYGSSALTSAGARGVYVTAVAAVVISFFMVPRFRWGMSALSWCLLAMGACLLTFVHASSALSDQSLLTVLRSSARHVCFALPPIILGVLLKYGLAANSSAAGSTSAAQNV